MDEAQRANQEYIEARDEMKDALVQKFSYKFGATADKEGDQCSIASAAIRDEVDGLLVGAAAPVTEANLRRLEQRLWRQARGKPGVDEDLQSVFSISAYTTGSTAPRRASGPRSGSLSYRESRPITPAMSAQASAKGSARGSGSGRFPIGPVGRAYGDPAYAKDKMKRSSPAPPTPPAPPVPRAPSGLSDVTQMVQKPKVQDVDWSTLDRLAAKLHEKDAQLQHSREKELQQRLKEDLDKQIADAKLKNARERDEDQRYYESQVAVLGNWQDQETENKRIAREKALVIQKDRNVQIQSDRARKEEERRLAKREADDLVLKVKQQEEQDKNETEHRRQLRKERVQKALQDSSAAAARKEKEMKSKVEKEDALMAEYRERIVERDKRCQENAWMKVANQREMLESTATRNRAEKQKDEESIAKAATEQAAKEARLVENEKRKENQLKELRLETQKYLFEQMRLKTAAKEKAKEERSTRGSALEVDAQKFTDAEAMRIAYQKQRALEHRAELERQIATKSAGPGKRDTMSSSELAMNSKLIDRVERLLAET